MNEIFECFDSVRRIKCKICECWLPKNTDDMKKSHLNGKGHKSKLEHKEHQDHILKYSVFVKGFDPSLEKLEERLSSLFEEKGDGRVRDVYVDKNSGEYCFIEFEDITSVTKVLSSKLELDGKTLKVKPRLNAKKSERAEKKIEDKDQTHVVGELQLLPAELTAEIEKIPDLSQQMRKLREHFQLTTDDNEMRNLICKLLQSVLEEVYPKCQVLPFGSSVNGMGTRNCDLDLTLLTNTDEEAVESFDTMKEIREILERFAPGFKNVFLVESHKNCSIIKLHHTKSNLNVDLSINNRLAIANTELLKTYTSCDQLINDLVFTLRHWAKLNQLIGRGNGQLTSYAFTLMIIHFLQHSDPPYLDCLQTCQGDVDGTEKVEIQGWNCWFNKNHSPLKELPSAIDDLLLQFFKYYADKPFDTHVVAIHTTSNISRSECHVDLNVTAFIVQDPFKLSHNVSQNVNELGVLSIRQIFRACYINLEGLKELRLQDLLRKFDYGSLKQSDHKHNIFTITLRNCCNSDNGKPDCLTVIKSVLVDDLKMAIHTDTVPTSSENEVDLKDVKVKVEEGSKKRKLSESLENGELTHSKKARLDEDDGVPEFTAIAYANTWSSRRKQRRLALSQNTSAASGKNDESLDKPTDVKLSVGFRLKRAQERSNDNCILSLKLHLGDVQDYQTFYAFYKKKLLSCF